MIKKRRNWMMFGHRKGIKEKDRSLGSVRYVYPISKTEALKRAKETYPLSTVTRVKAGKI